MCECLNLQTKNIILDFTFNGQPPWDFSKETSLSAMILSRSVSQRTQSWSITFYW